MFMLLALWQLKNQSPFQDGDTGWHIKAGEWIWRYREVPITDPWSFTAGDTPWYNISWLFDLALALLHQVGGLTLLYILTIAAYGFIGAILVRQALNRGAGFLSILLVFAFCGAPILAQVALCRPQMLSAYFVLASLYVFSKDRESVSWKRLSLLPLIMALWVNVHGGFLILPVMFACFLIEALVAKDKVRIRRILIIGVLTALAMLLNPYGYHIAEATLRSLQSVMKANIIEWRGVSFGNDYHYAFFLLLFIIGFRPLDKSIPLAEKLFALTVLFLTLASIRHGLVLAVATMPSVAVGLTRSFYESAIGERIKSKDADFFADMVKPKVSSAAAIACFLLIFALVLPTTRTLLAPNAASLAEGKTPERALYYMEANYANTRWLNEYGAGGLLIYYGAPEFKVAIDGRADTAYPRAYLKEYLGFSEAWGLGRRSQEFIKKYKIEGIVVATDAKLTKYLRRNIRWKRVYRDKDFTVFVKQLKTN
ncbi:MAG: hypothetical protein U1E36_09745 [Rickettsiales bacterium]